MLTDKASLQTCFIVMTSFLQRLGSFSRGSNVSRSNSLKKAITTPDLRATDQTGQSPTDINYDVIEGEPQGDLQSSVFYDTLLVQETGDGCLIQQCQHCKGALTSDYRLSGCCFPLNIADYIIFLDRSSTP